MRRVERVRTERPATVALVNPLPEPVRTEVAYIPSGNSLFPIISAIRRQWRPGDTGHCGLCTACTARDDVCRLVFYEMVPEADAPLKSAVGSPIVMSALSEPEALKLCL